MKQQNMLATDGKKLYAKPQINVVEIKSANIICTSGKSRHSSITAHAFGQRRMMLTVSSVQAEDLILVIVCSFLQPVAAVMVVLTAQADTVTIGHRRRTRVRLCTYPYNHTHRIYGAAIATLVSLSVLF